MTTLHSIVVKPSGHLEIKLKVGNGWHRCAVEPGEDVNALLAAVNANLEALGKAPAEAVDVALVKSRSQAEWTPEVLQRWAQERARRDANATRRP